MWGSGQFKSLLLFQESHEYLRGLFHLPSSYLTWERAPSIKIPLLFLHVLLNKMENQFIKEERI